MADEEWSLFAKYNEERREQETKMEMLRERLENRIAVESWWVLMYYQVHVDVHIIILKVSESRHVVTFFSKHYILRLLIPELARVTNLYI